MFGGSFINVGILSYIMHRYEDKLLNLFFYKPMSKFGVRELSRQSKLDSKTVMAYLKELVKQQLVQRREPKGSFPYFEANRLSSAYRFEKSHALMKKIMKSGLVTHLEGQLSPNVIVLFGSVRKGTYHEQSDIDIFVQTSYKRVDLSRFEKVLGHPIRLLFEKDMKNLSAGLLENIYNGEVLSGKLELP